MLTEEEVKIFANGGMGLIKTTTHTPFWGDSYDVSEIQWDALTKLINKILEERISRENKIEITNIFNAVGEDKKLTKQELNDWKSVDGRLG